MITGRCELCDRRVAPRWLARLANWLIPPRCNDCWFRFDPDELLRETQKFARGTFDDLKGRER